MDIVILALPRWDELFSSTSLSLALELSKKNRVFFIDNPFTWKDFFLGFRKPNIRSRRSALLFGVKKYRYVNDRNLNFINVTPLLVFPINFLPPGRLYRMLTRVNNYLVGIVFKSLIKDFGITKFIFINSFNPFYALNFNPPEMELKIYQTVDNISESKYIGKHGSYLERLMIRKYDIVLATSHELLQYSLRHNQNSYYLPNAVDFQLFKKAADSYLQRPPELANFNSKRIVGYVGNVESRIDFDLLRFLIERMPDCIFLLIGPLGEEYFRSQIHVYPNVVTTGPRELAKLPAYLKFIDCAIIPFVCNELTKSIYPLKLNEYLAAGKPIVTTKFSPDVYGFKDVISIVSTKEEFLEAVQLILTRGNNFEADILQKKASENTWEFRVADFWRIINNYISPHGVT